VVGKKQIEDLQKYNGGMLAIFMTHPQV